MAHVLVTGGTGTLGREIVSRLSQQGHTVRIMSRSASRLTSDSDKRLEWAQATLASGEGVAEAVKDINVIVHCASSPFRETKAVDVDGTKRLLQLAKAAGVAHVVHISITGIDHHPFSYYQNKVAGENVIMEGGIGWTILRTTQFFNLIDIFLGATRYMPMVAFLPTDFIFQPVDVGEVADHMVAAVNRSPAGRLPDVAGPEVLRLGEMAKVWLRAQGIRKPVVHLPIPGKVAAGFRSGIITLPERAVGKITWAEWVEQKYGAKTHAEKELFA